jgi:coproporphyrinogen III oxidase
MEKQKEIISFLRDLRDEIIVAFQSFETDKSFQRKEWQHPYKGGGEMSVLRGDVFEKAAVNWSAVEGKEFPMKDGSGPFFATGISLITHMHNPHAPTVHMNFRYIRTEEKEWLGGGYDLTPMGYPYQEDTNHFHEVAKNTLDSFDLELYPVFTEAAKKYFFIPHRNKERGVGGIFFDHYNTGNFDQDLLLWKALGKSFLSTILPIYEKRTKSPFSLEEKEEQLKLRAHYAEFNLVYDRGTQFGFASKGNVEAILCSMPPLVRW